jgi:hypothetical protein
MKCCGTLVITSGLILRSVRISSVEEQYPIRQNQQKVLAFSDFGTL